MPQYLFVPGALGNGANEQKRGLSGKNYLEPHSGRRPGVALRTEPPHLLPDSRKGLAADRS